MNETTTFIATDKANALVDKIVEKFYPNESKGSINARYVHIASSKNNNTEYSIGIDISFTKGNRKRTHYNVLPYKYLDMEPDWGNSKLKHVKLSGTSAWMPTLGQCWMLDLSKAEIPGNAQGYMVWAYANSKISFILSDDCIYWKMDEFCPGDEISVRSIPFKNVEPEKPRSGRFDLKENIVHDVTIQWHEEYRNSTSNTNIGKIAKSVFKTLDEIGESRRNTIIVIDWIEPDFHRIAKDNYVYAAELALKVFTRCNSAYKDCIFIAETYVSDGCKDYDKAVTKQAIFLENIGFRNMNSMYKSDSRVFVYKNGSAENLIYEIAHNEVINKK